MPELEAAILAQRRLGLNRHEILAVLREPHQSLPRLSTLNRVLCDHGLNRLTQPMVEAQRRIIKERVGQMGHVDLHRLPRDIFATPPGQTAYVACLLDSCSRLARAEVVIGKKALPVSSRS